MDIVLILEHALKITLASSIFFVWVVRYQNIIAEFKEYQFPDWFRDFIGIIKLSFCAILVSGSAELVFVSSCAMLALMSAAFITHIKVKHSFRQMLPSLSLMGVCIVLIII